MSNFICKKPITLSGRSFSYGEVIPSDFVLPERVSSLIRSNYIAEVKGKLIASELSQALEEGAASLLSFQPPNSEIQLTIPITTEKGVLELVTSSETVVNVLTIMQKTVEEAEKDISTLEDENALIMLNAIDSRKGIQKAAEERNTKLHKNNEIPQSAEQKKDDEDNTEQEDKGNAEQKEHDENDNDMEAEGESTGDA